MLGALQFPIQFSNSHDGLDAVIPGWSAGPDPESRDSGFDASHRPGMTAFHFQIHIYALAARCARVIDKSLALRGRGERRVPVAPAASRALGIGRTHTSNNEYTGITRRSRTQWF